MAGYKVFWRSGGARLAILHATLGSSLLLRRGRRHTSTQCKEKTCRPVSGTSGSCESGLRFYGARSKSAVESCSYFAVMERYHQFAVVDGVGGAAGRLCARFCAQHLTRLVAQRFLEQQRLLRGATDADGDLLSEEEAAAASWADALTAGFAACDSQALQEVDGACGALVCVVARSGVYIGSVGLGRVVIGTEDDNGKVVHCDEASSPHVATSEYEAERLGVAASRLQNVPTRMLGGAVSKQSEELIIALPDVVRHAHSEGRRFVILGSPGLWASGPRLPVQYAIEAYRSGRSPADEIVSKCGRGDVVAMVLVLPPGLGDEGSLLPWHDELVLPQAGG
eukprot:TRINITY_DN69333_c0_g1_i1.p1 TRINITY_DN69333_c0_g1~~TRINITY_DN69333_c0_g1_i1.p1  ORF type:complete len:358 (+),score=63.71 TRINITY_DN69333_c0_g1_i1:62-1075(+)